MKTISLNQLREILAAVKGATPIGFLSVTDARARQTGNPWAKLGALIGCSGVFKVTQINAMIGTNHKAAVERQQAREGLVNATYALAERAWGERISAALVKYKDEFYLAAQMNPIFKPRPIYMVPRSRPDGSVRLTPCPKEIVADLLPLDRTIQEAAHQGVARPVIYRNWKLSSIAQISIDGERYRVRQPPSSSL